MLQNCTTVHKHIIPGATQVFKHINFTHKPTLILAHVLVVVMTLLPMYRFGFFDSKWASLPCF